MYINIFSFKIRGRQVSKSKIKTRGGRCRESHL
jgi:hypothetical protein